MKTPFFITISPAKRFNEKNIKSANVITNPIFPKQTENLVQHMQKLSSADLQKMMGVSQDIANINFERYSNFLTPHKSNPNTAIFYFAGDVFRSLEAHSLNEKDLAYTQACLGILSGLYGLIRPLDKIAPYRLEMGTKIKKYLSCDLYTYWQKDITNYVKDYIQAQGISHHINLASSEYSKVLDTKKIGVPTIEIVFARIISETKYKVVGIVAKRARGSMARFIIKNRIQNIDSIKEFDGMGFKYAPTFSTSERFVFLQ